MSFQVISKLPITDITLEEQEIRESYPALCFPLLVPPELRCDFYFEFRGWGEVQDKGHAEQAALKGIQADDYRNHGKRDGLEVSKADQTLNSPGELSELSIVKSHPRNTDLIDWDGARH